MKEEEGGGGNKYILSYQCKIAAPLPIPGSYVTYCFIVYVQCIDNYTCMVILKRSSEKILQK